MDPDENPSVALARAVEHGQAVAVAKNPYAPKTAFDKLMAGQKKAHVQEKTLLGGAALMKKTVATFLEWIVKDSIDLSKSHCFGKDVKKQQKSRVSQLLCLQCLLFAHSILIDCCVLLRLWASGALLRVLS